MVFPTAVRKPSRLSDTCFAVFTPNLGFKPVFRPVAINLYYSSITSFTSVLVDYFWSRGGNIGIALTKIVFSVIKMLIMIDTSCKGTLFLEYSTLSTVLPYPIRYRYSQIFHVSLQMPNSDEYTKLSRIPIISYYTWNPLESI